MDFNLDKMPGSDEDRQRVRLAIVPLIGDYGDRLADVASVRITWQSADDASLWALAIRRKDGTHANSVFPAPIGLSAGLTAKRILNAVANLAEEP
jgi:hypothetical protein